MLRAGLCIMLLAAALCNSAGCRTGSTTNSPDYAQVSNSLTQVWDDPAPEQAAISPVVEELTGPQPVDAYIRFALAQNAGVQAARKRIEAAAMRVPQAASLKDPMLDVNGWPFYPNVPQTASGRMTVDMMVSQEVPWFGKLQTKAQAAEEGVNAARAQLAAAELKTIEEVKRGYYELYFVQHALRITARDRAALNEVVLIADVLYKTNKTSQQDVLRLQAELSNVDGELIRLRQMRAAAQADLAQVLHISPETPLAAADQLPREDVPRDLQLLYQQAVAARPELHVMLAEIERDRQMVQMASLEYYPDTTFRVGWGEMTTSGAIAPTADGIDNLAIGLSVNLPIYRQRLDAAVREAESNVVASARQYDQMKDETLRDVKRLFTKAVSERDLELLFRESIIPKTEQAFEVAKREYQVGKIEFANLIANWRELLRYHIAHVQLESQLRQTLASLERIVGGIPVSQPEMIPTPRDEPRPPPPQ